MIDAYTQGELVWLDIDTLIRERSSGRKSLDDVARDFFGIRDGSLVAAPYTFGDLVADLNAVLPYDWETLLRASKRLPSGQPTCLDLCSSRKSLPAVTT